MSYIPTLNQVQKVNMNAIILACSKKNITNNFTIASILAVCSKESGFNLTHENSYANTDNSRIRSIFGKYLSALTDPQLTDLKQNDIAFFNKVYGGRYGNAANEGYKYRGRGFNQITFKDNYKAVGQGISIDLVNNPDLLNLPENAALAMVQYFKNNFKQIPSSIVQTETHTSDINGFKNLDDSLIGIYHANAGWNKKIFPDTTGGFVKAKSRVQEFYDLVSKPTIL